MTPVQRFFDLAIIHAPTAVVLAIFNWTDLQTFVGILLGFTSVGCTFYITHLKARLYKAQLAEHGFQNAVNHEARAAVDRAANAPDKVL